MKNNLCNPLRTVLVLAMLVLGMTAFAQVTGKVVDAATNEEIIGASVLVQGTTTGTITDWEGNFSLSAGPSDVLVISYMGYKTQEIPVGNQRTFKVLLHEDSELLDEVVVVGYGVVKKNDATGSVTAIKPDDMNKAMTTNAQEMIQGKVAGVVVTSNDGTPGGSSTIRVRGGSSLSASNDPLIVIDGLAIDNDGIKGAANPLSMVNPNDIESFTVLKDASATAIYGSRASNGVIIITTKKGAAGSKPKVTYSGNVSMSNLTHTMDVMSGAELRSYTNYLYNTKGLSTYRPKLLQYDGGMDTDWQSQIYRAAISTDHNISIVGGTKNMPYRASIGYTDQNGIIKTSNMQRVTASLNLSPTFLDKHLTFNINAKGMYVYNRYAASVVGAAISFDPTRPVYAKDIPTAEPYAANYAGQFQPNGESTFGGYFNFTQGATALNDDSFKYMQNDQVAKNPVAMLNQQNNRANSGSFVGNIEADYKIHGFEDLHIHANFGADYSYGKQRNDIDPLSGTNYYYGHHGWEEEHKYNLQFSTYLQYYKDFTDAQHFDIMAGYEFQKFHRTTYSENYSLYPTTNNNAELAGTQKDFNDYTWGTQSMLTSFFGRANWVGWNQVMLTATVRADASTRFDPSCRWGIFPSVALGWKIKETFLQDVNWLNDLKLRAGYGITGQQNLNQGDFQYLAVYKQNNTGTGAWSTTGAKAETVDLSGLTEGTDYVIGQDGYVYYKTYRPNEFNPNLTWEKTTTYNVGLDYAFLNNRINGSLDYYYRVTDDLINMVDIPAGTNFKTRVISNVGSLTNQGVEFAINAVAIDKKNFKWDLGYNVTYNQNKITKLTTGEGEGYYIATGGIGNDQHVQAHAVGHAASSFYVYETARDEKGQLYQVDRNGDGVVDTHDKYFYHSPAAPVTMGFNSKWQFYGFDLGITFRASLGNYVYNSVLQDQLQYVTTVYDAKFDGYHNILREAYNAYYFDGCGLRNGVTDGVLSDYFVQKASFLRCDNITLGYSFNKKVNARVYATVSNPFVISPYKGLDPEVAGGIDNNMYPRCMSTTIGVNITF